MGTFHEGKHHWHGITLVVDMKGPDVFVGRCDDMTDDVVHLIDVGQFTEGEESAAGHASGTPPTKARFIERSLAVGVWPKHARLTVARDQVLTIKPLGEYAPS